MENIASKNQVWINHTVACLHWLVIVNIVTKKIHALSFYLVSHFQKKILPFLENVNEEVSSNNKDEVETMIPAVPKISYSVTQYDSHCLRTNVQFSAMEKLCSQWKQIHSSFIWFNTTNKKCHVQVEALIQLDFVTVQDLHPAGKNVIIQSYNASGFASQESIPFIFNINTRLDDENMLFWEDGYLQKYIQGKQYWILTIHSSIKIQAYVEDDNDILIEDDIMKAISFNGGISVTTAILFYA